MNSHACLIFRATLSLLVLGLAAPVWSQDAGPMPPAQNSSAPAASGRCRASPLPAPASATCAGFARKRPIETRDD